MNRLSTRTPAILGSLAALVIGLLGAQVVLFDPRLPKGADVLLHFYRLIALDDLVRQGVLYTRWFPNLALGYGYPIFNYYAPLSSYLAELWVKFGLDYTGALRATFAFASVVAAVGMFAWARPTHGQAAALVAAAAYALAPYSLYNITERGALAEIVALSWMPWTLYFLDKIVAGKRWSASSAALSFAAVLLSHNITALICAPVVLGWAIMRAFEHGPDSTPISRLAPALAVGLGLGLSGFFWLPALAEKGFTNLDQALSQAYSFRDHFVTLGHLFSLPAPVDPALLNPEFRPALSPIVAALAVLGLGVAGGARNRAALARQGLVWAAALACVFMSLPISAWLWDRLPLIRFVEFPWRFFGLGSLLLAWLAGLGAKRVFDRISPRWVAASAAGILLAFGAYGFGWQLPQRHLANLPDSAADIAGVEQGLGIVGTNSIGEYLPIAVQTLPAQPSLKRQGRLNLALLPPQAMVLDEVWRPLDGSVVLRPLSALTLTFDIFYFPGWSATVDGLSVPITPSSPNGLIQIPVPANAGRNSVVTLAFGSTPVRSAAEGLSIACVLATLIWLLASLFHPGQAPTPAAIPSAHAAGSAALLCACAGMLVLVKSFWVDGGGTPLNRTQFDGAHLAAPVQTLDANFGGQIQLMGVDALGYDARTGQVGATLYWRVPQTTTRDISIGTQLYNAAGRVVASQDTGHPGGGFPTSRWRVDQYARDARVLEVPPDAPPGQYMLRVRTYPKGEPDHGLTLLDENGAPVGSTYAATSAEVGPVTVTRRVGSNAGPAFAGLPGWQRVDREVAAGLRLTEADAPVRELLPGDALPLSLRWHASAGLPPDSRFCVSLQAASPVLVGCAQPTADFPTGSWLVGDVWRADYAFHIPVTVTGGAFVLTVAAEAQAGQAGDPIELGTVSINAPPHRFEPFEAPAAQRADFEQAATLVGYASPPALRAGGQVSVTLFWQARGETQTNFKVFVQLIDDDRNRYAGHDGPPAGNLHPTRTWVPGEYISDTHVVDLPADLKPGRYRWLIGLYDENNLRRLKTAEGQDAVVLDLPAVVQDR